MSRQQRRQPARGARSTRVQRNASGNGDLMFERMQLRSEEALRNLDRSGFSTETNNGQRVSLNRMLDHASIAHVRYNEIFIGKLPRDMFEDQLLPYISQPAAVFKIRYMMDFSHTNRGYCFVQYASTELAVAAIRYLDGLIIAPGRPAIGAKISFDNRRLYFGGLPARCTKERLTEALRKAEVTDILDTEMVPSSGRLAPFRPSRYSAEPVNNFHPLSMQDQCSSAIVSFKSHDAATRARRLLLPGDVTLFGRKINLDWAKTEVPLHVQHTLNQYLPSKQLHNNIYHNDHSPLLTLTHADQPEYQQQQQQQERIRTQSAMNSVFTDSSSSCTSPANSSLCYEPNNNTTLPIHELNFAMEQFQGLTNQPPQYQTTTAAATDHHFLNALNEHQIINTNHLTNLHCQSASLKFQGDNYWPMFDSDFIANNNQNQKHHHQLRTALDLIGSGL